MINYNSKNSKVKVLLLWIFLIFINLACAREAQDFGKYVDFELPSLSTDSVKLSNFVGRKLVLLNFWATWCPYCVKEIPQLKEIYSRYKNKGLEIIAVNLGENPKSVEKFVKNYNIEYLVLLDQKGISARVYGVQGIPTNFLIDLKGNVIFAGHHIPDSKLIEGNLPKEETKKIMKNKKLKN